MKKWFLYSFFLILLIVNNFKVLDSQVILDTYAGNRASSGLDFQKLKQVKLFINKKDYFKTTVLSDKAHQAVGISGKLKNQFADDQALLFYYDHTAPRSFWMPNTHFNIDIIFLDEQFTVLKIYRKMKIFPKNPKKSEYLKVPRTSEVECRHVLEIKSNTKLSEKIKIGAKLKLSN